MNDVADDEWNVVRNRRTKIDAIDLLSSLKIVFDTEYIAISFTKMLHHSVQMSNILCSPQNL